MTDRCHVCFVRIVPSREVVKTATDRTSSERMLGLEGELQTRKDGIKMNYEIVTLEEKTVVGILARTNNTAPDMGEVISGLWNRFFSEGIYESIPDKASEKALGIYTDYEGDEKADYTMMVACETTKRPETGDYAVRTIPAGRYARFIVRGIWCRQWLRRGRRSGRWICRELFGMILKNIRMMRWRMPSFISILV